MFVDVLKNNNMTIRECSEKTGIPKSTIADLANGKTCIEKMSAGNLLKLSQCFGVSMEAMMYYCRLASVEESVDYLVHEQKIISELGLNTYISVLDKTELVETCYKLNDFRRFDAYIKLVREFYKARMMELPEEYQKYVD